MFAIVAKIGDEVEHLVRSGADFFFVAQVIKPPYVFETEDFAKRALNMTIHRIATVADQKKKYKAAKFITMQLSMDAIDSRGFND